MINEFDYLPLKELRLIKKKYFKHFFPVQKFKLKLAIYKANKIAIKDLKLKLKHIKNQKIELAINNINFYFKVNVYKY